MKGIQSLSIARNGTDVDTSEFVNTERAGQTAVDVIARYGSSEDYGISVMTIAELRHGVSRADGPRRKRLREIFLDDVLRLFPLYPMDVAIALRVGDLDAYLKANGQTLLIADIIIAATALELGYSVATLNRKDFCRIPGLNLATPIGSDYPIGSDELI